MRHLQIKSTVLGIFLLAAATVGCGGAAGTLHVQGTLKVNQAPRLTIWSEERPMLTATRPHIANLQNGLVEAKLRTGERPAIAFTLDGRHYYLRSPVTEKTSAGGNFNYIVQSNVGPLEVSVHSVLKNPNSDETCYEIDFTRMDASASVPVATITAVPVGGNLAHCE